MTGGKGDRKGLVIVYTGNGKGKTSAAFGNVFRALGHGMKVLVVQFMKGDWPVVCGENASARRHKNLKMIRRGKGFCGIMNDLKSRGEHRKAAREAFDLALNGLTSGRYDLVVLDEINCVLQEGLLPVKEIEDLIRQKPGKTHLVLTGRGARKKILKLADLVTEMKEIKHPFRQGAGAVLGIDY